jgi:Leucine-rich repeat (LRR) protein
LEECTSLLRLNLSDNKIEDIQNLTSLSFLDNLEEIDLNNNPIQKQPNYNELLKNTFTNYNIKYEFSYKTLQKSESNINSSNNH